MFDDRMARVQPCKIFCMPTAVVLTPDELLAQLSRKSLLSRLPAGRPTNSATQSKTRYLHSIGTLHRSVLTATLLLCPLFLQHVCSFQISWIMCSYPAPRTDVSRAPGWRADVIRDSCGGRAGGRQQEEPDPTCCDWYC